MYIHEASELTKLTKKAIEYYTKQGLVAPVTLENGYRDFCDDDIALLRRVALYRRLGLGIQEIKDVLADTSVLQKIILQRELHLKEAHTRAELLGRLARGEAPDRIEAELRAVEQHATILEKLSSAFPGYYGQYIGLHFSRFLNEPILREEQRKAYQEILEFLDNLPELELPPELAASLEQNAQSVQSTLEQQTQIAQSLEQPESFLWDNREWLESYLEYRQSDDYKHSDAFALQSALKAFHQSTGYYDIFIPALKRLSDSYREYHDRLTAMNDRMIAKYPQLRSLE